MRTEDGDYEQQDSLNPKNKMKFYRDVYNDDERSAILDKVLDSVYHTTYEECRRKTD